MTRIGWLTDLHLNFVPHARRIEFYHQIRSEHLDVILVGGDTGEADSIRSLLSELEEHLRMPIYFVLGNHDFYGGSISTVREQVAEQARRSRYLEWLPLAGSVALTETTALVGHGSWADGRLGDFFTSRMLLNDYVLIDELRTLDQPALFRKLNSLGDEAARYLSGVLTEALDTYQQVILLTHVPPFKQACWHEGRISDDGALPHFACEAVGKALLKIMKHRPDRSLEVLCGHTHSPGVARIRENLVVHTGGAEYGEPTLQRIIEL